jgi:putative transposase
MCRALGVSPTGYYARVKRPPSARARADAGLSARIARIHQRSRAIYGVPRIHAELAAEGIRVGRKRVARLMANAGLRGVSRRQWITTTVRDRDSRPAPDLVERNFAAPAPNCLWMADITYIPTWAGCLYLAVVLDAFSRKIVGWAMRPICAPNWCSRRSIWRWGNAVRAGSSIIPIRAANILRGLRQTLRAGWRAALDGLGRQLLR